MTNCLQTGLTDEQVLQSRKEHGANTLTPPPREPLWKLFLEKFNDATIKILLAAAVISIILACVEKFILHNADASFIDSIGIFLAVALATLAGFLSELKSSHEFDLLNKVKDDIPVKTLRNGQLTEVSINDIVVGDIVQLSLGDKVPADGSVVTSQNLLIDEAVMTGESVAVEKKSDDLVFRGTTISDGHGRFVVKEVGDATRLGQIAANLGSNASKDETPLVQKLTKLAGQISMVGMVGAALIFAAMAGFALYDWNGWADGFTTETIAALLHSLLNAFIIAVTIIVVAVPEGLPMMVTVSLALNMMKMAKENCLIRKLVASETIGSATVICTDKTGTLTQNQMTVTWSFPEYKQELPHQLVEAISINTQADLTIGNPTECALLRFLQKSGVDFNDYREKYPRVQELSHNSERKMSLVEVEKDGKHISYSKGAPEKIVPNCKTILINGGTCPAEEYRTKIDEALKSATEQALRVLAIAVDDTLLALIGISDPIRAEVPHAVEVCHTAGVDVMMITGDAEPTARAIAKQAGIVSHDNELVLTSPQLAEMSDEELDKNIGRLKVLARATPMDKLRLVKALHKQGEVVAMTGDGTNDAPALKNADVGISMGITGTEVAKEASDIVLVDDNFKSIVTGIWWGRTLYENIQKFLVFQLTVNFVAMTCALIGPFIGVSLPLTVPQLLWINIIMDTFAALALSTDPPREIFMQRKPIQREASIITAPMLWTIGLTGIYQIAVLGLLLFTGLFAAKRFEFYTDVREPENIEALTVFFTAFVLLQFWNIFSCRSLQRGESALAGLLKNKLFLLIVTLIAVVQIGLVQASPYLGIGDVFRTTHLSLNQWFCITAITATIIPVAWGVRQIQRW
ncbi:calcium-translocating P-type ATPase, PMCA-type [Planctomycetales bacterium]|nr:calcium-translocating P-type ATPase, PMCA-type [Planctomycetales bacterium]GHT36092.1 calcium-translocating P-type ATPase, PMCA-type [Planctomycetales bacterium]